ncbi:ABC transporter permease/substrate-binding protein [Loigolactobacillus iwatensis]|uniref:ABC transporter permease/substrate-binding protein n=1 Tax=Loigolactobacillus iwatensis TaxID=1267156 RepID=UPI000F7EC009|nr:ABC transporter permease/substrate-binding protein [Loigolactobacillus iwatensis]
MQALINTFMERRGDLYQALGQHITISLVSLLIAMFIAIPLAIWVVKYKRLAEVLLQVTSVLQTIPSLALLGLLIPLVGIGTTPAIIALVVYALLPIFQNTYIGISEIDPSLEEAADAFGMSRMRKLFKVELPIAMPVIISGVRTALVLIIGTATLAALIGAGGLGSFILLGIDRNNVSLILLGAISSALLAIIFSTLIRLSQRAKPRQLLIGFIILLVGFAGYGVYHKVNAPKDTIVIAGKLGSEPDVLINMYKDLIEQNEPRVKVALKPNFGKTSFLFSALKNEDVDIYPEFSGTVLESLVKVPKAQVGQKRTPQQTYQLAKKLLKQQDDLTYLKPMAYNNTYTLAVKKQFAQKNDLKTITDLTKIQSSVTAGFDLEFIDRNDGYRGLQKTYGLNVKVKSMEPKLRYSAINNQDVNLVDGYSTDSELRQYNLVTLKDNKHLFPVYQGAPLINKKVADKYPRIKASLNQLAGRITEKQMSEMNYEVNVKKESPAKVAKTYLKSQHLWKEAK